MHIKQFQLIPLFLLMMTAMSGCGVNDVSYQSGYDDGYNAGYQSGVKILDASSVPVKVSGSFTVTVRELIPDYLADSITPRAAVVTFFQDGPFVLKLDEAICQELAAGEAFTFLVEEQKVDLPENELGDGGYVSQDALFLRHIAVTGVRAATEEELGLDGWRVTYTT